MNAFEWANAASVEDAVKLLSMPNGEPDPDRMNRPMGGGQDLLTTMKAYITTPPRVVNLKTIGGMNGIATTPGGGLALGALVTITQVADHAGLAESCPGLVEAAHAIATPQIRNLGTVGGNLGQRPRCWYFRLENALCLKRGGTECFAVGGENKYLAIFGDGPCHMVHPSDLAPMLLALDASVSVAGPGGKREVPVGQFFVLPKTGAVRTETILGDGDVITAVTVPPSPLLARSTYLKFKERESLDFALASVAAAVDLGPDRAVRQARVALGGVAPVPWRCEKAEAALVGKPLSEATIAAAAVAATDAAKPMSQNGFKVPLVQAIVRRALTKLSA